MTKEERELLETVLAEVREGAKWCADFLQNPGDGMDQEDIDAVKERLESELELIKTLEEKLA